MNRKRLTGRPLRARNRRILRRDKGICQICGDPVAIDVHYTHPDAPQVDHVIPWIAGGPDTDDNLRLSHRRCNRDKAAKIDAVPSRDW